MTAGFDIQPPSRNSKNSTGVNIKNQKSRFNKTTNVYLIIIFGLFVLFSFNLLFNSQIQSDELIKNRSNSLKNEINNLGTIKTKSLSDQLSNQSEITKSSAPSTQNKVKTSEESENSAISTIQITVLNGTQKSGIAKTVKDQLEDNGIQIDKIDNAKNSYSQTVIYYTTVNKTLAEKIQEILASYNPKLEKDNTLVDDKNIIVVIGKNQ